MAHYLVRFSHGANGAYVYPESIAGVAWTSIAYHPVEPMMVGETDAAVTADGKQVSALTAEKATKMAQQFRSSAAEAQGHRQPSHLPPG